MDEKTVYLASSAIVKRYLIEEGTEAIDALYRRVEPGSLRLAFPSGTLERSWRRS